MKRSMVLVFAVFAAASSISARLGDSGDQIEDSYGEIVQRRLRDDGLVTVVYKKDRSLFFVTFADGRSISESYSHVKGNDLSEREIMRFLKANSARGTWRPGQHWHDPAFHTQRRQGRSYLCLCEWPASIDSA